MTFLASEMVILDPVAECNKGDLFKVLQTRELTSFMAFEESVKRGHLIGSVLGRTICHRKVSEDLSWLTIQVDRSNVIQWQRKVWTAFGTAIAKA